MTPALAELFRRHVHEPLLLSAAETTAREYEPARAARVRELARAVAARRAAAAELRDDPRAVAALVLYEGAITLAMSARLAARGELDGAGLSRAGTWAALRALAASGDPDVGADDLEGCRALFESDDPLLPDTLDAPARDALRLACEALLAKLERGYEARSLRELRAARWTRLAGVGLSLAGVLGASMAYATRLGNIARDRPVRASSQRPGTPDPAGVVDGVRHGTFGVHTRTEADRPWVSVDLERPYELAKVVLYHRGDGWWEESLPVALELSSDGDRWREVARSGAYFTDQEPFAAELHGDVARYVRVIKVDPGYLALGEIEVYGEEP